MRYAKKLRLAPALFLSVASLAALLAGCGWPGLDDREQDKTYIVVVGDTKRPVFSDLDRIPGELDALLGDGWNKDTQPVIIICR